MYIWVVLLQLLFNDALMVIMVTAVFPLADLWNMIMKPLKTTAFELAVDDKFLGITFGLQYLCDTLRLNDEYMHQ